MKPAVLHIALAVVAAVGCTTPVTAGGGSRDLTQYGDPSVAVNGFDVDIREQTIQVIVDVDCEQVITRFDGGRTVRKRTRCRRWSPEELGPFTLVAPWGASAKARMDAQSVVAFTLPWRQLGLDPLADDTQTLLAKPWKLIPPGARSEMTWTPTREEATALVAALGYATETETIVRTDEPPPNLEVVEFEVEGPAIHAGTPARLSLRLMNKGGGGAFRVIATTRSSEPALHGLRFSFGWIGPGATKTRTVTADVPRKVDAKSAMIVVSFQEANQHQPGNYSKRFEITQNAAVANIAIGCSLEGAREREQRLWVDAGQSVVVACRMHNRGGLAAAGTTVTVSLDGAELARQTVGTLQPDGKTEARLGISIPTTVEPEQQLELVVTATETASETTSRTRLIAFGRMPALCPDGKLTRAVYRRKRAKLEAALRKGDLTQEEFDRYDAELVGCLE